MTDEGPEANCPWVGPASDEYRAVCVFAEQPGSPKCDAPATVHIRVADGTYGEVSLASCDRHASIARATAPVVAEHTYEGFCDFPASVWVGNPSRCVLDDSGEEPALKALAFAQGRA